MKRLTKSVDRALQIFMNEFSGIPSATLSLWLTEAQAALHDLSVGKKVVTIASADGKRISFTPAEVASLRSYVARLQKAISIASGNTSNSGLYSVATWVR